MNRFSFSLLVLLVLAGCGETYVEHQLTEYEYPNPIDTKSVPIDMPLTQPEYVFPKENITFSGKFKSSRINNAERMGKNSYRVLITPENAPINPSPWFAFKVWSDREKSIEVELEYRDGTHRYWPKLSRDGENWTRIDTTALEVTNEGKFAKMQLNVDSEPLWVSAQEIIDTDDIREWAEQYASVDDTEFGVFGESALGRELIHLDVKKGSTEGKEIIAVVSRQHPPEVTGNMAMIAFVEEIMSDSELSRNFRERYHLLVYPMLNPDGVDLGHWRHNFGGIDLNRDWAHYNQPEIRQVCEHIIAQANTAKAEVILGLDFHSTYNDIYYTIADSIQTVMPDFTNEWIANIEKHLEGFNANVSPSGITSPVSKNWFYNEFKAVGIVYEIGDDTPRDIIRKKGEISAREMMKLLLAR